MSLSLNVEWRRGGFRLDAAFESVGRFTALFGPSGSGKTSLIQLIAGMARPDRGRIAVAGRVLADTQAGVFVPAHRRRLGVVFQEARLFPHLSVRANLGYGRRLAPPDERREELADIVELLGIGHLLARRPAGLSGGEAQRVAIGRALLASPRLLLLDEPLASLDEDRKGEIMPYLERLRDETRIPIVYVSHSLAEVARLATDIVVMADGRVSAAGPAGDVLAQLDLLPAAERGEGGAMLEMSVARHDDASGMTLLRSAAGEVWVARIAAEIARPVRLRIRARDVIVATERPAGISALNILAGTVSSVAPAAGHQADISIDCGGQLILARITRRSADALGLVPGRPVHAIVKAVTLDAASLSGGRAPI